MSLNVGVTLWRYQGRCRSTCGPDRPLTAYHRTASVPTNHAIGCARSTLRSLRPEATASGRVTRRASSDPACLAPPRGIGSASGKALSGRRGEPMPEWRDLSHVRWDCTDHVVILPKSRRRVPSGRLRRQVGGILRELCRQRGIEWVEGHALPDHVPLGLSIPPKSSVAFAVGFLTGKGAVRIHRELLQERRRTGLPVWA